MSVVVAYALAFTCGWAAGDEKIPLWVAISTTAAVALIEGSLAALQQHRMERALERLTQVKLQMDALLLKLLPDERRALADVSREINRSKRFQAKERGKGAAAERERWQSEEYPEAVRKGGEDMLFHVRELAKALTRELMEKARKTTKPGSRSAEAFVAAIEGIEELLRRLDSEPVAGKEEG